MEHKKSKRGLRYGRFWVGLLFVLAVITASFLYREASAVSSSLQADMGETKEMVRLGTMLRAEHATWQTADYDYDIMYLATPHEELNREVNGTIRALREDYLNHGTPEEMLRVSIEATPLSTYRYLLRLSSYEGVKTETPVMKESRRLLDTQTGTSYPLESLVKEEANFPQVMENAFLQGDVLDATGKKQLQALFLRDPSFLKTYDVVAEKGKLPRLRFYLPSGEAVAGVTELTLPLVALRGALADPYEALLPPLKPKVRKPVALTFDDGPSPTTTPLALQVLEQKKVKATFFVLGRNAEIYPELILKELKDGHTVENHTYHHYDLTTVDMDTVRTEVEQTANIIRGQGGAPHYVRPPYGAYNGAVKEAIKPYNVMLWDVDTEDWKNHNQAEMIRHIREQVHPGAVILMHDIHMDTVRALPAIIDYLRSEGYEPVSLDELMQWKAHHE